RGIQNPQEPITAFSRYKNTEKVTHSYIKSDDTSVYLKVVLLYKNEPIEERVAEKTLARPVEPERRVSTKNKKFDAFVSYYELTGIDIRRENQHVFRNDSELASRVITLVDEGEFSVKREQSLMKSLFLHQ